MLVAICLLGGAPSARAVSIRDAVCRVVMALWGLPAVLIDIGFTGNIIAHGADGEPVGRSTAIAEVVLMSIQLPFSALGLAASISERSECTAAVFAVTTVYSAGLLAHGAWALSQPEPEPPAPAMMATQPLVLPSLRPPRLRLGPGRFGSGLGLGLHGTF